MLTPKQIDDFPAALVDRYGEIEVEIIKDMARRISGCDYYTPSAEWQAIKMAELGHSEQEIVKLLSRETGKTEKEIADLMQDAGTLSLKKDDAVYKKAGLRPLPLNESEALKKVLATGVKETNGLFRNLTKTTARAAIKQLGVALDQAYMQVVSGAFDPETVIRRTVKGLARSGVDAVAYPSGHVDKLDVAVRRAVQTGVNQTALKLQLARISELNCDLVQTTAHGGARPSHAQWQGKIFSVSGKSKKYPGLKQMTGYGSGDGLGGWNCRHSFYPFFEGLSKSAYSTKELADYNAAKYTYNGKQLTEYEASQQQRYIERQIRSGKREYAALSAAGLDPTDGAIKVRRWQDAEKDFLRQTGLKRQSARSQVVGYGKREAARAASEVKGYNTFSGQIVAARRTSTGMPITAISPHVYARAKYRGITSSSIVGALTSPLKTSKIRDDNSQQFIGERATVAINVKTGKVVTVWPTSASKAEKLKKGGK